MSRRRFLSSLGLTAGARVLAPFVTQLASTVWGAEPMAAKNLVLLSFGGGLPDKQLGWDSRPPSDVNPMRSFIETSEWSYHEALAPLAPWRDQTAILRNLSLNLVDYQHSGGYGLLGCGGYGDSERTEGHAPVGITFDQLVAERVGAQTPVRSLLFGIDADVNRATNEMLFARAADQPISYPVQAARLFDMLFADASVSQQAIDRRVLARVNADVNSLRQRLAASERAQLDSYLASLDAFDRRRSSTQCLAPGAPTGERGAVKEFPVMLDMAATALRCGLTRVVGGVVGGGNTHYHFPALIGPHIGTELEAQGYVGEHGHDGPELYDSARTIGWKWFSSEVARFLELLGPTLDDTVVVVFSDGAHAHHNLENSNWRFVVIAGRNVPIRTGGRMLSFGWDVGWEPLNPDSRAVASLWVTIARALGVSIDTFGSELGGARTNGPLRELT
ncbi:MAG: DUF1552 domain-containing protein [Myxococcota bacterium]